MNRIACLILFAALMSCAKHESAGAGNTFMDYGAAVALAEVSEEPGGRLDLKRCLKNWGVLSKAGRPSPSSFGSGGSVLLEMGSSGYAHYDYVRIDGMLLSNSDGSTVDVSQTPLGNLLKRLYENVPSDFVGSARGETDDGECYFLSIKSPSASRTVAFYGVPSSTSSGTLVREIIAMWTARASKADGVGHEHKGN